MQEKKINIDVEKSRNVVIHADLVGGHCVAKFRVNEPM